MSCPKCEGLQRDPKKTKLPRTGVQVKVLENKGWVNVDVNHLDKESLAHLHHCAAMAMVGMVK